MSSKLEAATAGAAISAPWWLPYIREFSDVATYFLIPLGGLTLVVVQIVARILITRKALRNK